MWCQNINEERSQSHPSGATYFHAANIVLHTHKKIKRYRKCRHLFHWAFPAALHQSLSYGELQTTISIEVSSRTRKINIQTTYSHFNLLDETAVWSTVAVYLCYLHSIDLHQRWSYTISPRPALKAFPAPIAIVDLGALNVEAVKRSMRLGIAADDAAEHAMT